MTVPTVEETLRIKAFLIVRRNQTRDHLDLAALSDQVGVERAAEVLSGIDDYYADQNDSDEGIASQLVRQLSDPQPADRAVIDQLPSYRRLRKRWSDWDAVTEVLGAVAAEMEEVLTYSRPYGVAKAMERIVARAREAAEASERQAVAVEVVRLIDESGLSRAEFASRIGTSASRLSTYATGRVTPSAALLVRMRSTRHG